MHIQVTQKDIDNGKQVDSHGCAIAVAIKRQYGSTNVQVSGFCIQVDGCVYGATDGLAKFVTDFDTDKTLVFPTEFIVPMIGRSKEVLVLA